MLVVACAFEELKSWAREEVYHREDELRASVFDVEGVVWIVQRPPVRRAGGRLCSRHLLTRCCSAALGVGVEDARAHLHLNTSSQATKALHVDTDASLSDGDCDKMVLLRVWIDGGSGERLRVRGLLFCRAHSRQNSARPPSARAHPRFSIHTEVPRCSSIRHIDLGS